MSGEGWRSARGARLDGGEGRSERSRPRYGVDGFHARVDSDGYGRALRNVSRGVTEDTVLAMMVRSAIRRRGVSWPCRLFFEDSARRLRRGVGPGSLGRCGILSQRVIGVRGPASGERFLAWSLVSTRVTGAVGELVKVDEEGLRDQAGRQKQPPQSILGPHGLTEGRHPARFLQFLGCSHSDLP